MSYWGISLIYRDHMKFVSLFVQTVFIERMSLVMTFLTFHHVFIRCHTRAYTLHVRIIRSLLVYADNSCRGYKSCYDIFELHHIYVRCHTGAHPLSYQEHLEVVGLCI